MTTGHANEPTTLAMNCFQSIDWHPRYNLEEYETIGIAPQDTAQKWNTVGNLWLLVFRKHFFCRTNNAPIFDPNRKLFRAMPKHTPTGISDIFVSYSARPYFLEVKRPGSY
jgi:hypothetical protein